MIDSQIPPRRRSSHAANTPTRRCASADSTHFCYALIRSREREIEIERALQQPRADQREVSAHTDTGRPWPFSISPCKASPSSDSSCSSSCGSCTSSPSSMCKSVICNAPDASIESSVRERDRLVP
ncbi:hypothetical protein DNTS_025624 [Danionella cerebrum]|uniref:Uncharacterized protein n=1 Tax=Danionella cerebrum TaxID=2873325 RepID=A0A553N133_9TELE|nr:hypothetical protein DNTS_025624 [Danionella translucida]